MELFNDNLILDIKIQGNDISVEGFHDKVYKGNYKSTISEGKKYAFTNSFAGGYIHLNGNRGQFLLYGSGVPVSCNLCLLFFFFCSFESNFFFFFDQGEM